MNNTSQEQNVIDLNNNRIDQEGEIFLNNDFLSKLREEIILTQGQNPSNKKQTIKNYNRKKKYFKCDLREEDSEVNFELFEKSTSEEEDMIIETKVKKKQKIKPKRKRIITQKKNTFDLQQEQKIEFVNNESLRNIQQEKSNFVDHLNYIFTKDKDQTNISNNQISIKIHKLYVKR